MSYLNSSMSHPSSDLCTGSRQINALNINSSHSPTKFSQPANLKYLHNLISVQSSDRTRSSSVVTLARPSASSSLQVTQPLFSLCIALPLESAPFFISATLMLFTLLMILIWHTSPHQSPCLCSHHLSSLFQVFYFGFKIHLFHKSFFSLLAGLGSDSLLIRFFVLVF